MAVSEAGNRDSDADGDRVASIDNADLDSVSAEVIGLLTEVTGRKQDELEPLNDVVDTDSLDTIFADRPNGIPRDGGVIVFQSNGCEISVYGDGVVVVREL